MNQKAIRNSSVAKRIELLSMIVGLITFWGMAFGSEAQSPCTFPGKIEVCRDPTDRRRIQWQESSGSAAHILWLRHSGDGVRSKLLEFNRSVDVLWSPNGQYMAITNHLLSDESVLMVFSGRRFERSDRVDEKLVGSLGEIPEIFRNGHRYFVAVRWINADRLQFRVRAYDSEPGKEFVGMFQYDVTGRVRREPAK